MWGLKLLTGPFRALPPAQIFTVSVVGFRGFGLFFEPKVSPGEGLHDLPIVSIGVPFFGLTNSILRILKGNPKKELQWRL